MKLKFGAQVADQSTTFSAEVNVTRPLKAAHYWWNDGWTMLKL